MTYCGIGYGMGRKYNVNSLGFQLTDCNQFVVKTIIELLYKKVLREAGIESKPSRL